MAPLVAKAKGRRRRIANPRKVIDHKRVKRKIELDAADMNSSVQTNAQRRKTAKTNAEKEATVPKHEKARKQNDAENTLIANSKPERAVFHGGGGGNHLYGISYVKPNSARMQQQGRNGGEELPPQVYRIETAPTDINLVNSNCSGSKAALNFAETLNCIIDLETDVAVITQSSSAQMKRYLLPSSCPGSMRSSIKCTRRSSLRGILTDGSHIVAPGTFSCFHYKYDTSQRLSLSAEVNAAESDVQIGLRTCAGSGKFLVDNASMQEHKVSPEATKSCLGYRLEMYVSYKLWKKLDIAQKRYLWDIIQGFGDMMKAFADERNARRMHRPMRPISTRDSFRFDLKAIHTPMEIQIPGRGTRSIVKTKYFFRKDCVPQDVLSSWSIDPDVGLYPVGVVQYSGIHDDERVKEIEAHVDKMSSDMHLNLSLFRRGAQRSYHHGGKLTRTKYFLGARYLWRREELLRPGADIGKGIRVDVPRPFRWMRDVEAEFIKHSVIEASFANSFAANVYHDGSEGLGQHYDDQARLIDLSSPCAYSRTHASVLGASTLEW